MRKFPFLNEVRKDFEAECGCEIPGLKKLVAGLFPAALSRRPALRRLVISATAAIALLLFALAWAVFKSLGFALLVVIAAFGWALLAYINNRTVRRCNAVAIPIKFIMALCKDAASLKLPVSLVDVLGLELFGWYIPHNNFFARWPWVEFSIPLDVSTTVNLSDAQVVENTLYLINLYAANFSQKTQCAPLVIRNLHFSRNSLEFEVVLNAGPDAREFLKETTEKFPLAGIDDPDFGAISVSTPAKPLPPEHDTDELD